MRMFQFNVDYSALECENYYRHYRGIGQTMVVRCSDGTSVQFPARLMRPFISINGVRGTFMLTCDDEGKNAVIRRL